ncbi:hypothetical protein BCV69DRAFT_301433 [Microstroma glucosiphilum]|uniref:Uncharacterized protein n=1 Tax=Pseudomicrostroma glucosiphilum TaxID=1684307 RepID=A0A316U0B9_9BASI|nr:hypothetical protein BCV69DRAFT_301433 [Pseudomicrostroma glucosiphilum]PWN18298.1 hypothetical protein BCV69DRAFT_301433 [Pseudomicrostroma glucosiphilum]
MAPPPLPPASRQPGAPTPATSASSARIPASNTSSNSKSRPSSMIIPSQQRQQTPTSSPRPRSSSILSTADSAASTSPSNPSSPRAPRTSSSALPSSSSYRSFLGPSKSNDRLAPSSPSQQRSSSMAGSSSNAAGLIGHDPHLTPTPSSRKQSLSSSSSMTSIASAASGGSSSSANRGPRLGASDYRYSLGPAPVRFPKEAGGSRRGSGIADVGPALLSASPTTSSASAVKRQRTPSPRASRSRATSSNSHLNEPTSADQAAAEYPDEDDQEITPRPTRPHSRLALTSTTGATGGSKSDANTPGSSSLLDVDKRFSTRTSSSATLRGNYAAGSGGHDQGAILGSSVASSSSAHLQRPGMPPRPSSKVLTTFPFPHPTTPRGTTDEEGRTLPNLLGFSWVSKLFGGSGTGGQDKEGGETAAAAATRVHEQQEGERRGLLTSQQEAQLTQTSGPSPRTSRAAVNYGAVPSPSPRPRSDYQQRGAQYAATASVASQQPRRNPSLSSLTTSEPDPSDPYGYRRLAGPDLLPTYHAEHVNPRRRKRELQRRWEKRRKVWMVVGAVLLFCGLLFVGAKALDTMRSGGESGEGGDGSGGGGPPQEGERGHDSDSGGEKDGSGMSSLIAKLSTPQGGESTDERSRVSMGIV